MKYKIETHTHSNITSMCGKLPSDELISLYKQAGYSAIVMTDHYYDKYFNSIEDPSWEYRIRKYLEGYYEVLNESKKQDGPKVILGIELRFSDISNDYLVYGIDEVFLLENPALYNDTISTFKKEFSSKNPDMLIIQAHPFRPHITLQDKSLVDGYEILNQNPRQENNNDKAEFLKQYEDMILTSGSDCHQAPDVGLGGIKSDILPKNSFEFAALLRSGNFTLITSD